MSSPKYKSVEDCLTSLEPLKAKTLKSVIDLILAEFPELESKVSWNVPQIYRNGEYIFGFSASKQHLALSPWSPRVMENFKSRFGKLVVKMNLFQIPIDWEIDKELIKDLVRARLAELE